VATISIIRPDLKKYSLTGGSLASYPIVLEKSMNLLQNVSTPSPPEIMKIDHLSYSSLTTYAMCPRKYYYRYLVDAPHEFIAAVLAFGGAFHRVVEMIHRARIEGRPIPDHGALLNCYQDEWSLATALGIPVVYAKTEDELSLRDMASRMISAYREHLLAADALHPPAQIVAIEHAERFRLLPDVPPIEMRVDLLEIDRDGQVIVTDVKTSRSCWTDIKLREALPQLILYARGLMPIVRALGATKIVPRFTVVTKSKAACIQELSPSATQDDLDRLKQQVQDVWHSIQNQVFVQRTGWQCAQCPYKKRCLG
jgi:hypothetical protein